LATISNPEFEVLGAGGGNLLGYLAYGIQCVTMSTASCFPKGYTEAFNLWEAGKVAECRVKAFQMNKLIGALGPWKNTEDTAELKAVLELLGICQRWTYPPFQPCTDEEVERIRKALVENGIL
jgi:dihydrodipicolinate synthase/N-acetylneuraminate lyase